MLPGVAGRCPPIGASFRSGNREFSLPPDIALAALLGIIRTESGNSSNGRRASQWFRPRYLLLYCRVILTSRLTRLGNSTPSRLTGVAVWLVGRKRLALADEWRAHLAGDTGHDPVTCRKSREASGFVVCAVKLRLADITDAAWVPVDAVLKSRTLSNLLVLRPHAPRRTSSSGMRGLYE